MARHAHEVAWIASLVYFVQGALGISGIALPLFLRSLEWSVAEITTVTSVAALPWTVKILYGLVSDTIPLLGYRRKSYLVVCSIISSIGWLSLVLFPAEKQWILVSLFLANLGFAATDVITDGLIVEHSTQVTSHIYQSIAWGSRSFGAIVSGVIGGWLAAHWRPEEVFLLTMLLPLTVTITVIWMDEKKIKRGPFEDFVTPIKRCTTLLLTPNLKWFVLILIVASSSASFGIPFFFFMKETLGFHETFLGLLASLGWSGAFTGSLIYGRWLRRFSPKKVLRWAIWINSLNILSTVLIWDQKSAFILIFIGGIMGCITLLPLMSASASLTHHSGVEGSMFAVLMSIFNMGQIGFGFLGGKVFNIIGLYPLIVITGVLGLSALFFVDRLQFNKS